MTTTPQDDAIFESWLETGTVSRVPVKIFGDHEGVKLLTDLYDQQDKARKAVEEAAESPTALQRAVGEQSELAALQARQAEIDAEVEQMEERVARSRSVWMIRPLTIEEAEAIEAEFPVPPLPTPTQEQTQTDKGKKRWQQIVAKYQVDRAEVEAQRVIAEIAVACESIEAPAGTAAGVSRERLAAMRAAPYGSARIKMLNDAVKKAMDGEKEPERPFSSSSSESDPA